ncbi:blackelin-4 isoform X2 [Hydra vulgaris]|uniref:Blackelin-4 isoform X2 n=1 Tax=Hydra vulgaris TaxID=6087 RepID=A0ABM4D903_HYDVU
MLVLLVFFFLSFITCGEAKVSCSLVQCHKPLCKSGVLIKDPSGCCKICEKIQEGEVCGGSNKRVCDDHLFCMMSNTYLKQGVCEPNKIDCKSKLDPGPCFAYLKKWFYNHATKKCQQFVYGGCRGNNNRYDSKDACDKSCVKST